ncbi:MAG: DUF2199 domain-containing protein [Acidobacteriales bacterium]|nr:DUF2199 domain-containing protein [Terriglobales bacterium]
MSEAWVCATCGETHDDIPLSVAAEFPDPVAALSREDFENRVVAGSDQCLLDGEMFFLRGLLEIPIFGQENPFLWGVWVTLWEKDFDEISDCWEEGGREHRHGPFKGRFAYFLSITRAIPCFFSKRWDISTNGEGDIVLGFAWSNCVP